MLNHFAILLTAIAGAKLATADVVPTGPGPADVYRVGGPCKINWNTDASGAWNNFSITLKTGANLNMIALETVAEGLDGTTGTGEYEWTCPDVSPNSKIYFYEFAQPGETTSWTTRFTIAAADGSTTDPTNETDGIPWGIGKLASGSSASSGNAASGSASSSLASSSSSSSSSSSISSASFSAASSASSTSSAESVVVTTSATLASAIDNSNVVTITSAVSSGFSSVVSRGSSAVSSAVVRASSSVDQDSGAGKVGAGLAMGLVGAAVALFA